MSLTSGSPLDIHYEVIGAGPPVVLLHGLSDSHLGWHEYGFVDQLAHHYQLILVDARGHGASATPHDPSSYRVHQRVADVVSVLDDLRLPRAHVLGYSYGGYTALAMAAIVPDRVASIVVGGAQPFGSDLSLFRDALADGIEGWTAILEALLGGLSDQMKQRVYANDVDALQAAVANDLPDLSRRILEATVPALLYAGRADDRHDRAELCARLLARGSFVSMDGNHMRLAIDAEQVVPPVRDFLAAHAPVPA